MRTTLGRAARMLSLAALAATMPLAACGRGGDGPAADSARTAASGSAGDATGAGSDSAATAGFEPDSMSLAERGAIRASAGSVRRDGATLRIAAAGGGGAAFADDSTEGEAYAVHHYAGRVAGAPFHLVRLSRYEGGAWYLVHERTGRRVLVDAPPVVAPDGARFVTASMDLVAAYDPNRLAIWRIVGDGAEVEWEVEPADWGPSEPRWVGPDTVALTMQVVRSEVGEYDPRPARVARTAGGWTLVPR